MPIEEKITDQHSVVQYLRALIKKIHVVLGPNQTSPKFVPANKHRESYISIKQNILVLFKWYGKSYFDLSFVQQINQVNYKISYESLIILQKPMLS